MPDRPASRGYRLRAATVRDLPTLTQHRIAMFAEIRRTPPRLLTLHGRQYRRWVRPLLVHREVVAVVAERGDQPVASGCVWFQPSQPRILMPKTRTPYIMSMYTHPDHRGRGLATRIVRRLLAEARRRGYPRVTLHASDMGRGVYARLGFESTSEMRFWLDRTIERRMRLRPRRR